MVGRADAAEHQQLRRVDRAAGEDDLVGEDPLRAAAALRDLHADGPAAVEHDAGHERPRPDLEVGAVADRPEVRLRRRPAPAVADVAVERRDTLLAVAVDVGRRRVAGLLGGREPGPEQGARRGSALEGERAAVAAPRVVRRRRGAVLHPLEVRQAVGERPRLHPGIGRPALVVERVAALEDHPVDAAAAAEDLAPGVVDPAAVHERLGLRLVLPVVEAAADRERQRRRHVDERVEPPVGAAGLEDEDAPGGVRAEAVGEHAPGRSATDDDDVPPRRPIRCHRLGC